MEFRFYLDNDVDVQCAARFTSAGHECWTTRDAGRQAATDDEQTVYACNKHAVIVTHDRRFTNRRKRMPMGQHVRLICDQPDAGPLIDAVLPTLIQALGASPDLVVEVRPGSGGVHSMELTFGTEPHLDLNDE